MGQSAVRQMQEMEEQEDQASLFSDVHALSVQAALLSAEIL
jgi:hypothetical protein